MVFKKCLLISYILFSIKKIIQLTITVRPCPFEGKLLPLTALYDSNREKEI